MFPITDFVGVAATSTQDSVKILDVRHGHEWRSGHIRQAIHVPLEDLPQRVHSLALAGRVLVYCQSGVRAAIAASLLDAVGAPVVLVDDDWSNAEDAGNTIVSG